MACERAVKVYVQKVLNELTLDEIRSYAYKLFLQGSPKCVQSIAKSILTEYEPGFSRIIHEHNVFIFDEERLRTSYFSLMYPGILIRVNSLVQYASRMENDTPIKRFLNEFLATLHPYDIRMIAYSIGTNNVESVIRYTFDAERDVFYHNMNVHDSNIYDTVYTHPRVVNHFTKALSF